MFKTCPDCGANLDPCERCDCHNHGKEQLQVTAVPTTTVGLIKTLQVSDSAYDYIMQGSKDLGLSTAEVFDEALLLLGRLAAAVNEQEESSPSKPSKAR